jgi:tetratricopeptide (TPR) repeat protein
MNVDDQRRQALAHHQAGRLVEAERVYRGILNSNPSDLHVEYLLGTLLAQSGRAVEALPLLTHVVQSRPEHLGAQNSLGVAYRSSGDLNAAIHCHRSALKLAENDAGSHGHLAVALQALGALEEAVHHHQCAVKLDPSRAGSWFNLGVCQQDQTNMAGAANAYAKAVQLSPDNSKFRVSLGYALKEIDYLDEAIVHLEHVRAREPDNQDVLFDLGDVYRLHGDFDAALECYDRVLVHQPTSRVAITKKAEVLEQKGDFDAAFQLIQGLVKAGSADPEAALVFAAIAPKLDRVADGLARLEEVLVQDDVADKRHRLHFQAGKLCDSDGDYDRAFYHYKHGNDTLGYVFDRDGYQRTTDALISTFSRAHMARLPRADVATDLPVFIIGMPRSGTTLTEQVLASHPDAAGAGELPDISRIAAGMSAASVRYPDNLDGLTAAQLTASATRYLATLKSIGPDARRVTDKMPTNFLHLGLIKLLFPEAPVIHCTRNPVDTCLSIYFQNFSRGHAYATDLADIGFVYREYRRLMAHWHEVVPTPVFECSYEELVANQEDVSRRLIDFIGLEWDDACLAFHKNKRVIHTASYDQVRRPIYQQSVQRWRRYERHLDPLFEALGPDLTSD